MVDFMSAVDVPSVTSTPSGIGDGALWYRSDIGQFFIRLAGSDVEIATSPYGSIYMPNGGTDSFVAQAGTISAGTPTAGLMYLIPFWPCRTGAISKIYYEVTTQGVSASGTDRMRFGVYNADSASRNPTGAAVQDWGDVDLEVAPGVKTHDISDWSFAPTLYWLAVVRQTTGTVGTPAQVRLQLPHTLNYGLVRKTADPPTMGTSGADGYWTQSGVTGALPTIGSLNGDPGAAPRLALRWG